MNNKYPKTPLIGLRTLDIKGHVRVIGGGVREWVGSAPSLMRYHDTQLLLYA